MNRRQISPLRLRPRKVDADVNRIINHAAKLVMEYNQIKINNIMQSDKDNQKKVNELLKLSNEDLPRLIGHVRHRRKKKSKVSKRPSKEPQIAIESDNDAIVSDRRINNSLLSHSLEHSSGKEEHLTAKSVAEDDSGRKVTDSIHTEIPEKRSSLGNVSRPLSEKNLQHSEVISEEKQVQSNRTMDEVNTFESESSMSNNDMVEIEKPLPVEEIADNSFIYDVEIKTGDEDNKIIIGDVFLRLNGESMTTTQKLCLKQYFRPNTFNATPFNPGNHDFFQIAVPVYLGAINNIVIGLDAKNQDENWFLEYICVKDRYLSKEYRFPCRRWLGPNSADQLSEVKLGYTPSYKQDYHSTKSTSLDDQQLFNGSVPHSERPSKISTSQTNSSEYESKVSLTSQRQSFPNTESHLSEESEKVSEKSAKVSDPHGSILFGKSIHSAIITNDYERVKLLCSSFESLKSSEDEDGNSAIHLAAKYYVDSRIINYLVSQTVDPNQKSKDGYTPFLLAVIEGNLEAVKYLKEIIKVNCDTSDNDENTALHLATIGGHENIVRYLISCGALPILQNRLHETPLQIAQRNGDVSIVEVFKDVIDSESDSSIYESSEEVKAKIVKDNRSISEEVDKDNRSDSIESITEQAEQFVSSILKQIADEHLLENQHSLLHKDSVNTKSDSVDASTDQADQCVTSVLNKISEGYFQSSSVVEEDIKEREKEVAVEIYSSEKDPTKNGSPEDEDNISNYLSSGKGPENVNKSLNNDEEFDEDHRGIAFNKRISTSKSKRKASLKGANSPSVPFNDDYKSPGDARFDDSMSTITSRSSSSLSSTLMDSSSEEVLPRRKSVDIQTRSSEVGIKNSDSVELALRKTDPESVSIGHDKVIEDNENAGSIQMSKEMEEIVPDSRTPEIGEDTLNETQSPRIRKTNKSPGIEHPV